MCDRYEFSDRRDLADNSVQFISDGLSIDDGGYDNVSTSAILRHCKLRVLVPYFRLLSLLGWRELLSQNTLFENPLWIKLINFFYVTFILILILAGYTLQYSYCYRQDGYRPYNEVTNSNSCCSSSSSSPAIINVINSIFDPKDDFNNDQPSNTTLSANGSTLPPNLTSVDDDYEAITSSSQSASNDAVTVTPSAPNDQLNGTSSPLKFVSCRGNFFALYFVPNMLHFFAYLSMFHLMRTPESEKLETLMERGFLQTTHTTGWILAHKKLANSLRSFLWMCLAWFTLSIVIHGLIIASRVGSKDLTLLWHINILNSPLASILLTVTTVIGLTFNDLICASIVTSYTVHAQLNISYIVNLCSSIREKRIGFQEFYKRIEESRKFIDYLNNDQALGLSFLQITVGCKLSVGVYALLASNEFNQWSYLTVVIVLLSLFFWLTLFMVPIIQAIRLTSACCDLKRIGHELRARPFGYQLVDQSDLDSLLLYTTNLSMVARIIRIPVKSSCILIICILFLMLILMFGQLGLLNV